jgi:hypothetical protein
VITSVDYQWMKRESATSWVTATAEELGLLVTDNGGGASFHIGGGEVHLQIPPEPSGTVAWDAANLSLRDLTEAELTAATPDDLCSVAVAYDDKLGLRLFAGGADAANPCVAQISTDSPPPRPKTRRYRRGDLAPR